MLWFCGLPRLANSRFAVPWRGFPQRHGNARADTARIWCRPAACAQSKFLLRVLSSKRGDNVGFGAMSRPDSIAGLAAPRRAGISLAQVRSIIDFIANASSFFAGVAKRHDDSIESAPDSAFRPNPSSSAEALPIDNYRLSRLFSVFELVRGFAADSLTQLRPQTTIAAACRTHRRFSVKLSRTIASSRSLAAGAGAWCTRLRTRVSAVSSL